MAWLTLSSVLEALAAELRISLLASLSRGPVFLSLVLNKLLEAAKICLIVYRGYVSHSDSDAMFLRTLECAYKSYVSTCNGNHLPQRLRFTVCLASVRPYHGGRLFCSLCSAGAELLYASTHEFLSSLDPSRVSSRPALYSFSAF